MTTDKNERFTLDATMDYIRTVTGIRSFDLDPAASDQSHKAPRYYTVNDNGLVLPWFGNVFCNPPYDDLETWVSKAFQEIVNCKKIVMLVPANRCEQAWWQNHIEPNRDSYSYSNYFTLKTIFIPKRTKFGTPEDPTGVRKNNAPKFGCVLLIWSNNVAHSNATVIHLADYNERCSA